MTEIPPPIIDSARLLAFAINDEDVKYTNRINFVGSKEKLERLGEVPCLAICSDYANADEILLFFCNSEWEPQGVIPFTSTEEAKLRAERGYRVKFLFMVLPPSVSQPQFGKALVTVGAATQRPVV
jgi:hypothetical protein